MPIKKVVKDYFTFTRKERNAAIVLLMVMAIFLGLPYLIKSKKQKPIVDAKLLETVNKLQNGRDSADAAKRNYTNYAKKEVETENKVFNPFNFDPNTVTAEGWHQLGLRDKTIHTLMNYRNKGGRFREAADINKIWGIRPEEAERLIRYIHIVHTQPAYVKKDYAAYKAVAKKPEIVDINTATVEELRNIPGMGNGMLFRVIRYRERLGGFLTINQVKETFGMNDSSYILMLPYFKLVSTVITQININTATDYDLSAHPYIDRNIAKAIVLYRIQHGRYSSVADIKKIVFIKDPIFIKISPYLTAD